MIYSVNDLGQICKNGVPGIRVMLVLREGFHFSDGSTVQGFFSEEEADKAWVS